MICAWITTEWVLMWFQEHLFMGFGQASCAFTGVSLGKLDGRHRNWELSCCFQKVFEADLFSSYCKMETFRCRARFKDQRDHIVSHLLNCYVSWAIWHRSRRGGLWRVFSGVPTLSTVELLPFYGAGMLRYCTEKCSIVIWTELN